MFPLNPLSLLCGILLCLPLAVIFTLTTPSSPDGGAATCTTTPATLPIIISLPKSTDQSPDPILSPPRITLVESKIKKQTAINAATPPPPPPEDETDNQSQVNLSSRVDPNPIMKPTKNLTAGSAAVTPPAAENESDDEQSLFKLASRVDSNPNPLKRRKLAFMFLITTSLPFAPLWEIFFSRAAADSYNIYVHADPRVNATETFVGVFAGRAIKSIPTRRNTPSLTAAARRLLAHALLDDESNSMFAIVSPSCVPIHSFKYTYRTLMKSRKSYIEILENEPNAYKRWAARGEYAMVPEVEYKDFRIGSQWWVLTRNHARIITNDTWIWSKFKLPCMLKHLCYPEEHYFSTLLSMVDPRGCIPCTLTHVDWKFGDDDGHPRTYEPEEVGPGLIRTIRRARPRYGDDDDGRSDGSNSTVRKRRRHDPFLFARKFAPGALHQLLNMAEEVIFKD